MMTNALDTFYLAYADCASWADLRDEDGEPLGDLYYVDEIAEECEKEMRLDCADFLEHALVQDAIDQKGIESVAHDFWLTRNRYSAGFWDRGYPGDMGARLTDLAHAYGAQHLYIGDDGQVWIDNI